MKIVDGVGIALEIVIRDRGLDGTELLADFEILPYRVLHATMDRNRYHAHSLRRQNRRCSFQPKLGYCHLTHLELLNFATHGHRKLIDKSPVARDLVVGDLTVAVAA